MTGRPEALFPLFAGAEILPGIGPKSAKSLETIGLGRVVDFLFHLPVSGIDRRRIDTVQGHPLPGVVTLKVCVDRHMPAAARGRPHRVLVHDSQLSLQLVFFHAHREHLERQFPIGAQKLISGRAEMFDGVVQMAHPDHVLDPNEADALPLFEPVHGLTGGVSAKVMRRAIAGALERLPDFPEWADPHLVSERGWPTFAAALRQAHDPEKLSDLDLTASARERIAYDEVFAHQVTLGLVRARARARPGRETRGDGHISQAVIAALPFQMTGAQARAVAEITTDMGSPVRMNRLLQGDVGAGKTLVALMALIAAVEAGGQGALMAPTEVLARQHLRGLRALGETTALRIDILTGRDKGAERREKLARLAAGDIDILVGTHALFQDGVVFSDLRLAVVDEQHRFGVRQRLALSQKGDRIDVLVMTATPIPRSLSLAQFGDMDLSVLDEKPPGRKPVTTVLLPETRRDAVIERLKSAIAEGAQAYWVCPLVHDSEVTEAASAEARFGELRAVFASGQVGLVHGQLPPENKDAAMADFVAGRTRLLVATTVIEVGVDVPNASIMVIEGAEGFGLSQIHQLRGRVGRGSAASSCLLLYRPNPGETAERRLMLLRDSEDGFALAEADLAIRGAGDVLGTAQSGLPRFRVADLERQAPLLAVAQSDARALIQSDPALETARGMAVRHLLWLLEQDRAIGFLSAG